MKMVQFGPKIPLVSIKRTKYWVLFLVPFCIPQKIILKELNFAVKNLVIFREVFKIKLENYEVKNLKYLLSNCESKSKYMNKSGVNIE